MRAYQAYHPSKYTKAHVCVCVHLDITWCMLNPGFIRVHLFPNIAPFIPADPVVRVSTVIDRPYI